MTTTETDLEINSATHCPYCGEEYKNEDKDKWSQAFGCTECIDWEIEEWEF